MSSNNTATYACNITPWKGQHSELFGLVAEETRIREFLSEMESKLGRKASSFIRPGQEDHLYQPDYRQVGQVKTCDDCGPLRIIPRAPRKYTEPQMYNDFAKFKRFGR